MNSVIELHFVKNLTSETVILNCPTSPVEAVEYSRRSFSIEVASEKVSADLLVSMKGTVQLGDSKQSFEATGKIVSVHPIKKGFSKVEIYLHQFDKKLWSDFLDHKEKSQSRVDQLFNKIKGES